MKLLYKVIILAVVLMVSNIKGKMHFKVSLKQDPETNTWAQEG